MLAQLFQYFDAAPTVINNMLKHAYSKSLTDAISKLLCVEQEEVRNRTYTVRCHQRALSGEVL